MSCSHLKRAILCIVALTCSHKAPSQISEFSIPDDANVINTVLLSFFEKQEWNDSWNTGQVIVVNPQWLNKERGDVREAARDSLQRAIDGKEGTKAKSDLVHIQADLRKEPLSIRVIAVPPLRRLHFDKRIVFGVRGRKPYSRDSSSFGGRARTKELPLARAEVMISPPGYSHTGLYASMVVSAGWSMHSANLYFILERQHSTWKIRHVSGVYLL